VVFPRPAPRAVLTEFAERRGDFAIVAAAIDLDLPRVVLGGVAPVPFVVTNLPASRGSQHTESGRWAHLAEAAVDAVQVRDEPGVSAHYRRGLVRTLVERACAEAEGAR